MVDVRCPDVWCAGVYPGWKLGERILVEVVPGIEVCRLRDLHVVLPVVGREGVPVVVDIDDGGVGEVLWHRWYC